MNLYSSYTKYPQPQPEPEPEPENNDLDISPWSTVKAASGRQELAVDNSINQYMKYARNVQISGSIFNGYKHDIDVRYIDNLEDIVKSTKDKLKKMLIGCGMINLSGELDKIKYHIHSHTLDEILLKTDIIVYVCNCGD